MSRSLSITIRRTGLVLAATAVAAVVTGSALAVDRPAASFLTKKQIEAISQSWAARGGVFYNRPAASFLSPAQIEAISQSWAARGGVFYNRPAASFLSPAQIEVMSESWAARARHARSAVGNQGGLDWGDFGMGAAAMLALVLLVTGLAAGARYSRKSGIRLRPAS
jgi:PepSY-associated TM region